MTYCKTYYKIVKDGKWHYAKYRRWWMPFYLTIDYWSSFEASKGVIEEHKTAGIVYRDCV